MVPHSVDSGDVRSACSRFPGGVIMSFPGGNYGGKAAGNTPLYSLSAAVVFFIFAVVMVIFTDPADERYVTLLIGICLTTIPSLIASAFSERASRDIRNGVVVQKVEEALENKGVAEVARNALEATPASIQALSLLVANMQAQQNALITPKEKDTENDGR